jgi:hypothetical protein
MSSNGSARALHGEQLVVAEHKVTLRRPLRGPSAASEPILRAYHSAPWFELVAAVDWTCRARVG